MHLKKSLVCYPSHIPSFLVVFKNIYNFVILWLTEMSLQFLSSNLFWFKIRMFGFFPFVFCHIMPFNKKMGGGVSFFSLIKSFLFMRTLCTFRHWFSCFRLTNTFNYKNSLKVSLVWGSTFFRYIYITNPEIYGIYRIIRSVLYGFFFWYVLEWFPLIIVWFVFEI